MVYRCHKDHSGSEADIYACKDKLQEGCLMAIQYEALRNNGRGRWERIRPSNGNLNVDSGDMLLGVGRIILWECGNAWRCFVNGENRI